MNMIFETCFVEKQYWLDAHFMIQLQPAVGQFSQFHQRWRPGSKTCGWTLRRDILPWQPGFPAVTPCPPLDHTQEVMMTHTRSHLVFMYLCCCRIVLPFVLVFFLLVCSDCCPLKQSLVEHELICWQLFTGGSICFYWSNEHLQQKYSVCRTDWDYRAHSSVREDQCIDHLMGFIDCENNAE